MSDTRNRDAEPMDVFERYLTEHGLRMTNQRRLILDVFLKEDGHPTSEDIYDTARRRDASLGQATVYRTMKLLSDSGLAKEVNFGDAATRYEHKYGHQHHDHLICERCRKTLEILDQRIERCQEELAEEYGFRLTGHRMYLFGICPECRRREESEGRPDETPA